MSLLEQTHVFIRRCAIVKRQGRRYHRSAGRRSGIVIKIAGNEFFRQHASRYRWRCRDRRLESTDGIAIVARERTATQVAYVAHRRVDYVKSLIWR